MESPNRGRGQDRDGARRVPALLCGRDWVYLGALLVPCVLALLALKAASVLSTGGEVGPLRFVSMMRSDVLFWLGYSLVWIGLFAVVRRGIGRKVVLVLFHAATLLVALVVLGFGQFYQATGSPLDAETITSFFTSPQDVAPVVASRVTPGLVALALVALVYVVFSPALLSRLAERRVGGVTLGTPSRRSWLGFAGILLAAYALISLSALPTAGPSDPSISRNAFINIAASEVASASTNSQNVDVEKVRSELPTNTRLVSGEGGEKRNVVWIFLESTRARSLTPYNEDLKTTPYMNELAKKSIFAEHAYASMPHTTNAQTASLCGIDPPDRSATDSLASYIPSTCMAKLMGEQGYKTAYIQSPTKDFEHREDVVGAMGYDEFYSLEDYDTKGFEKANYFGYEDDILLKPSKEWLQENDEKPFFVTYNTITPHDDYQTPDRYGIEKFAGNGTLNRYQNSVRYMDFFVRNIIQQYKDMGLYDDTVFIIQGDHGEGFGEHGRYQHDNTIWNEGLHIPLMIVDPKDPKGRRISTPVDELDILPTLADLLGYKIEGGSYPGRSMLEGIPEDRTLKMSCWYENECMASIKGDEKYIYHYGDRPDEFYDLSKDPLEKNNLAPRVPAEELQSRREALLSWRAKVNAVFGE